MQSIPVLTGGKGHAMKLDPKSKAATILLRKKLNVGYCSGPEFPGDTIRKAIDKLFAIGFLAETPQRRMCITSEGARYLSENHLVIPS